MIAAQGDGQACSFLEFLDFGSSWRTIYRAGGQFTAR